MTETVLEVHERVTTSTLPRLGLIGLGWIGRARLQSLVEWGGASIAVIADRSPSALDATRALIPDAAAVSNLDELLDTELDGVVVATPPALHEKHAGMALALGLPVFCQKPLATTLEGTSRLIESARRHDRLLGVDMSYRRAEAFQTAERAIHDGELGHVYAVEAVFHNPYRPAQQWSRHLELSGGGCLLDLGTHLVDLALAALGSGDVTSVTAALFESGRPLTSPVRPEDYALVSFRLEDGSTATLVTSWEQVVDGAIIRIVYRGHRGSVEVRNVEGSFYDFETLLTRDRHVTPLSAPPDDWGGRVVVEWAERLARGDNGYDPAVEALARVALVIDRAYGRIA